MNDSRLGKAGPGLARRGLARQGLTELLYIHQRRTNDEIDRVQIQGYRTIPIIDT